MTKKKRELPIYHDDNMPMSIGCSECPEREICGGMFAANGHYSCMGFCQCLDVESCNYVCRRNLRNFIIRSMEIRGFSLDNVPRCPVLSPPKLPLVAPMIYHASARVSRLQMPAVAVKLSQLFDHKTGLLKYSSREEIAARFLFQPNARLIVMGVDDDLKIEPYWSAGRAARVFDALSSIKPDLVTTPNFSTFANVVRWDNLHGIKRIAISWSELVSAGIPTSLHLNARTERDWERLTEFICQREEVQSIAVEFGTGSAVRKRARYSVDKLLELAGTASRDLQLIVEGGSNYLSDLNEGFHEVVFIDTTSHTKSFYRQRLVSTPANLTKSVANPLPFGDPIDGLFQHNAVLFAKTLARSIEPKRDLSAPKAVGRMVAGT